MKLPTSPHPELGYQLPPFTNAVTARAWRDLPISGEAHPEWFAKPEHRRDKLRYRLYFHRVRLAFLRQRVRFATQGMRGMWMRDMYSCIDTIRTIAQELKENLYGPQA